MDAAMARALEFTPGVPSTPTLMLHRINVRQQQIAVHIANKEPEYLGRQATVALVAGAYALSGLNPLHERITRVEVDGVGTSPYTQGDRVSIVPIMDVDVALAPRMTLRDNVLTQVGTDMALVSTIRIYYSKRFATVDGLTDVLEYPEQFHELSVVDLSKHLLRKTLGMKADERTAAIALLDEEEKDLLADLDRHLEHWRYPEVARFAHSAEAQARPME